MRVTRQHEGEETHKVRRHVGDVTEAGVNRQHEELDDDYRRDARLRLIFCFRRRLGVGFFRRRGRLRFPSDRLRLAPHHHQRHVGNVQRDEGDRDATHAVDHEGFLEFVFTADFHGVAR